jgi:hypothetical protein
MKISLAFPSWCYNCKAVTGTRKEKLGKGQGTVYYCKKCGQNK